MKKKLSAIDVNDIFDELKEENNRLQNELLFAKKCVIILSKFKLIFDEICLQFESQIHEKQKEKLIILEKEYTEVSIQRVLDENSIDSKSGILTNSQNDSKTEEKSEIQCKKYNKFNRYTFICDSIGCDFKTNTNRNLMIHKEKHHSKEESVKSSGFEENFVDKKKLKKYSFKSRIKPKNKALIKSSVCDNKRDVKKINGNKRAQVFKYDRYRCDWIGCSFKTEGFSRLKAHMNYHTGERPEKCTVFGCNKAFVGRIQLQRHIRLVHTLVEKTMVCETIGCGMKFKNKPQLMSHMKTHSDEKPFACHLPNCEFRSLTKSNLERHILRHTAVERIFKCNFDGCDKSYKLEIDLKSHATLHDPKLETKCDYKDCNREFKNNMALNRHKKFDHSDNEISCEWPGCEYRTKNPKHYRVHLETHESERKYVCEWVDCGRRFKTVQCWKNHSIVHSNNRKYKCVWPECGHASKRLSDLRVHMKTHSRN